ncbi:hypothetical protein ACIP9G_02820 [Lysinibacillus sp. NPDC093197]|uniref:hypothetical protein n=1 Tax=Lysinibacillus sp. NPDC093197 TaxID=3364132 RepID=UPI0038142829
MSMAFLFRKKQDKSPFAEALQNLIKSEGEKLILSSGFFAFKTKLIDWIVEAATDKKINEIVIIAGYIKPNIKVMEKNFTGSDYNVKNKSVVDYHEYQYIYNKKNELEQVLKKGEFSEKITKKDIEKHLNEINKHYLNTSNWFFTSFCGTVNQLNDIYKKFLENKGKKSSEFEAEIQCFWDEIKRIIDDNKNSKIECNFCKLNMFVHSIYYGLYKNKIYDVPVRIILIPKLKNIKWHSKIALKLSDLEGEQVTSAIVGSSNLTTASLPNLDNEFYYDFPFECDVYITTNEELGLPINEQDDFSVIPVEPTHHSPEGILNSIYQGIKPFLEQK